METSARDRRRQRGNGSSLRLPGFERDFRDVSRNAAGGSSVGRIVNEVDGDDTSADTGDDAAAIVNTTVPSETATAQARAGRVAVGDAPLEWGRVRARADVVLRRVAVGLIGLPFLGLGVVAAVVAEEATLVGYQAALLSSCFAVALGAVSVSFVVLQLTPYRTLLRGVPHRQLVAALLVAALAVVPVAGLLSSSGAATRVAVAVIPTLILASVLLVRLAQREGEPVVMLARAASDRTVRHYCWSVVSGIRDRLAAEEQLEILRREQEPHLPPPSHEIFRHVSPPVRTGDPFEFMASLAAAAVERRDVATFTAVVERAIDTQAIVRHLHLGVEGDQRHRIRSSLGDRAAAGLTDIVGIGLGERAPSAFAERCVDVCLDRLRAGAEGDQQGSDDILQLWILATHAAADLLVRGHSRALIEVLVAGHHAAEVGMVHVSEWHERYALTTYPRSIATLGERAIEQGDVDSLYRVLEALGWIGCAAVLRRDEDVGKAAVQGLVQLGRLARKAKLECFWSRCLLAPVDHADERIQWVASWVAQLEDPARERWLRALETAWSRLRGHPVALEVDETRDKPKIRGVENSERPYIESIDDNGRVRSIDYSDVEMTKNAHLY